MNAPQDVFAELAGQEQVVDQLRSAAAGAPGGITHAWLFTGPPGSGRSVAARAFGRLAERDPDRVAPYLERAVRDPSYDVRSAALPALALVWSRQSDAHALGSALLTADGDSTRRFVALEALVAIVQRRSAPVAERAAAHAEIDRVAESGHALARLAAEIGRSFIDASPAELHLFLERLFGA